MISISIIFCIQDTRLIASELDEDMGKTVTFHNGQYSAAWRPNVEVVKLTGESSFGSDKDTFSINVETGEVTVSRVFRVETSCSISFEDFPFDRQKCDLKIQLVLFCVGLIHQGASDNLQIVAFYQFF